MKIIYILFLLLLIACETQSGNVTKIKLDISNRLEIPLNSASFINQYNVGAISGYDNIISLSDANYIVYTLNELKTALNTSINGDIIYIDDNAIIDITNDPIIINKEITLASGRGRQIGGQKSSGALIQVTQDINLVDGAIKIKSNNVRITGLNIVGPYSETGESVSFQSGIVSNNQNYLEIDNNELSGWSHASIYFLNGSLTGNYVHHNHIHHNQRKENGYGIEHGLAYSQIMYNYFEFNRHSIAATGVSGSGYEAAYNYEGQSSNHKLHAFDVHGEEDRAKNKDISLITDFKNTAGNYVYIHHNYFKNSDNISIYVRGLAEFETRIEHNSFPQTEYYQAIRLRSPGHAYISENVYRKEMTDPSRFDFINASLLRFGSKPSYYVHPSNNYVIDFTENTGFYTAFINDTTVGYSLGGLLFNQTHDDLEAYSGNQSVIKMLNHNNGVLTAFDGGYIYFSPDGNNLGGGGSSFNVYDGTQKVTAMIEYNNGVLTAFDGGYIYFSPDGSNLGGGGSSFNVYDGTQKVTAMIEYNNGVLTAFEGGYIYFSPDGNNLGGGGSSYDVYNGNDKVTVMIEYNDGVLTAFNSGSIYYSTNGKNLVGGNSTFKMYSGTKIASSIFQYSTLYEKIKYNKPPLLNQLLITFQDGNSYKVENLYFRTN